MIEDLQDRKVRWHEHKLLRNEPLLEYVWEVALEFAKTPSNFMDEVKDSYAPSIFANRYAERNLTTEERYNRHRELYNTTESLEEFSNKKYSKLDISFKERFLANEDLQNTIQAFGLDVSKFWYLLLFVYDYVEDFATNAPTPEKTTLDEFNLFNSRLEEATSIRLSKNGRKSYETEREDIMKLIKVSLEYYVNTYNNIIDESNSKEEQLERLREIGLDNLINQWAIPIDFAEDRTLDLSYKKVYFTKILLYFLAKRKAKTLPHIKTKVSKDKLLFVSRLIYTVGYHSKEYNEEYDKDGNKNRMLSNLLRRYSKEKYPMMVHRYYKF